MSYKTYKKPLAFLAIVVLLLSGAYFVLGGYGRSGPDAAPNLDEYGLVGYWNMEEGKGQTVYDRSGNGNNGTLGASTAVAKDDPVFTSGYSSAGPGGTALKFDGKDDYVDAGNNSSIINFTATDEITVCTWVYINGFNSTMYDGIVGNLYGNNGYLLRAGSSYTEFYIGNGTAYSNNRTNALSTNTWTYICGKKQNDVIYLYINGEQKDSDPATGTIGTSTRNVLIGFNDLNDFYFKGIIDEVRIYNRALSADEIRQHYNQKKPILELKMDEGSGTTTKDESFNNNDGTLYSGVTSCSNPPTAGCPTWVQGKYGSAISFDGTDDYVNIGSAASLNITGDLTLEAWIKSNNTGATGILGKDEDGGLDNNLPYSIYLNSGKINFKMGNTSTFFTATSNTVLSTGAWYYVAATISGTNMQVYINGTADGAAATFAGSRYSNSLPVYVGRYYSGGLYFNGTIDEPRIYNYARTADEILADYNDGKAAHLGKDSQRDDGLVGYWNMEEGKGQTVYDRSGNSNNGTFGASTAVAKDDPVFTSGYSSAGAGGTALKFDGKDDYVDLGTASLLRPTGDMTVEAWVKVLTISGADGIVGGRAGQNDYTMPYSLRHGGIFIFSLGEGSSSASAQGGSVVVGEWAHIVGTISGNDVQIYKNGVLSGNDTFSGTRQSGTRIVIGADEVGNSFANNANLVR